MTHKKILEMATDSMMTPLDVFFAAFLGCFVYDIAKRFIIWAIAHERGEG